MLRRKGLQRRTPLRTATRGKRLAQERPSDKALLALWREVVLLNARGRCEACAAVTPAPLPLIEVLADTVRRERAYERLDARFGSGVPLPPLYRHASTPVLQAHHVYGRRFRGTRYDSDNGCCLCKGHHRWAHDAPLSFGKWWEAHVGAERAFRVQVRHTAITKGLDLNSIRLYLLALLGRHA